MSRHYTPVRVAVRRIALTSVLVAAVACSTVTRKHGFVPLPEDLEQMSVGVTTRDEVLNLVGPPTTGGTVDSQTYYYVESERSRFGPFEPEVVDRNVVAISFSPGGVMSNIERFGLEDGRVVVLSRRVTDDGIADVTVISQLMGAIGRIDAGQLLGGGRTGLSEL